MKFRNQVQLCLAVFDFEAHIILSLCLSFQGTRLPVWEKFNPNVAQFLIISISLDKRDLF